jgi:phage terminase Nu1 subunit (DNA packaging protein)
MSKPKNRRTPDAVKPAAKRSKAPAAVAPPTQSESQQAAAAAQSLTQTFTVRQFAALFDVSPDTVSRWCAGGMPHEVPGKSQAGFRIILAAACPWVVKYALEPPPESQKERLARAQATKVERENAEAFGQLVDAVQVEGVLQAYAVTLNTQQKTIVNRVSHEFAGITDAQRIRERLTEEFATCGEALHGVTADLATACRRAAEDAAAVSGAAAAHAGAVGRRASDLAEGQC